MDLIGLICFQKERIILRGVPGVLSSQDGKLGLGGSGKAGQGDPGSRIHRDVFRHHSLALVLRAAGRYSEPVHHSRWVPAMPSWGLLMGCNKKPHLPFAILAGITVLVAEKGLQVAAAMYDAKDKHVLVFDTVNDDILPHRHAAASGTEIVIAGTSDIGEARRHEQAVGEGVN
ncbi:MAG: hypothetical protein WAO35_23625 [Terriglobia bacterium]